MAFEADDERRPEPDEVDSTAAAPVVVQRAAAQNMITSTPRRATGGLHCPHPRLRIPNIPNAATVGKKGFG
jgi:hypothetical protein